MAHVLIAGCGYLGSALGVRLAADGHVVWGLRRTVGTQLPMSIRSVEADLTVPNTLRNLPRVDFVFYLAAPSAHGGLARDEEALARATFASGLGYLVGALV